ncbi:MAG TPA: hypothetical protein VJH95_06605 [Candidatus Nanoarchaeia archaeon]|nr:hypothetical protein [Candidatus Nanoarchaeia archaeon]
MGTLLEYINKFIGDFPIFWITLGIFLLVVLTLYIYDDYKSKKQIEKDVIHIKEGVDRIENHLKK